MFKLEAGTEGKTLESINSELAALDEQLDEGDITVKDYNTKRDALNKIKCQIEMYDDINRQVAVQTVQNIWQASQREFFAENKEYIENPVLNAAYVHVVNGLLASEEGKKMTDRQLLLKAKETVDESLGRTARKGEGDDREKAKRAALAAAKKAEAEKGKGSVSLGNMPLAESQEMGDRFDTLDKLTGEEFENAVAALSESDRQAYGRRV
jgi:DNA helicase IV